MPASEQPRLFTGKPDRTPRADGRRPGRPTRAMIELRNEELLDRSLDLFLDQGFEATTIDTICATVGMARRTIYSRYGDKETLFKAALQRAIDQWIVPVERLRERVTADLEETLIAIGRLWVGNLQTPSGQRLVRIANTEVYRNPEVARYLWERTTGPTIDFIASLFRERLRPAGSDMSDVNDAAAAFMILVVVGSVQLAVWSHMAPDDHDRQVAYRTRLFLNGAQTVPIRGAGGQRAS